MIMVITNVATATPLSPVRAIAAEVARAEAMIFTALLPIKIVEISCSLLVCRASTRAAWRLPLRLTNWRIRASEAAVSAVSALEKNADNKINNRIRAISPVRDSHIIDSSPDSHAGFARQSDVQQRPCQSFQPE